MLLIGGCTSMPQSQQVAAAQGNYSFVVAGEGLPVVVFEAGLGDGKSSWRPVFAELAKTSRVFAYDRAGYGNSSSNSVDRSAGQIVRELHDLLQAVGTPPPYVLVGHSLGGTYVGLFARTYPAEVAGVVLIDARHEDFSARCKMEQAHMCEPPDFLVSAMPGAAPREFAQVAETMQQVRAAGTFPPVPLAVLTGTRKLIEGPAFNKVWLETQRDLSRMSPAGQHIVCTRCGHYVHKDDPKLVIQAIRDVVQQAAPGN